MKNASDHYKWKLDYGSIAMLWRAGCIIRSVFLDDVSKAYKREKDLENLILDDFFRLKIEEAQEGWRRVVATAVVNGIPVPALSSALAYYDGIRSGVLPSNLIQAQRDYFGAHTYERVDSESGKFFHTDWTGKGGPTSSSGYNV